MSTERFKNVTSFVINLLNNKTTILLNLAEYRLILAESAKYQTIFRKIEQDNGFIIQQIDNKARNILQYYLCFSILFMLSLNKS